MPIYKIVVCSHCGKEMRYEGKEKPKQCECKNPYWDKPEVEYQLFMLQKSYVDNDYDINYLKKMYPILALYTKKLLLKRIKGKFYLASEQVDEKVFDVVHKIYEYYLRNTEYRIVDSFAGCINFQFLDVLHNRKERKKNDTYSLNVELDDKGNELLTNIIGFGYVDLEDEKNLVDEEYFKTSKELINNLSFFLQSLLDRVNENFESMTAYKVICGVNHLLNNKTDIFMDKYFDSVGRKVKNIIQWFFTKIYEFLHEHKSIQNFDEYIQYKSNEIDYFRI